MLNRRNFIESSFLSSFLPFGVTKKELLSNDENLDAPNINSLLFCSPILRGKSKIFIAHRGVHLSQRMVGENSLESIKMAKRSYFDAVEFDIWQTSDKNWVVIHDKTLNRTCVNKDGTKIGQSITVSEITLSELREKYILNSGEKRFRSVVPTMVEFLSKCKLLGLVPFVEIKPKDLKDEDYLDLIQSIDEIMGKGNYIITSNNEANETIRRLGIKYVPLMGILYKTSFERLSELRNIIVAISIPRLNLSEYENSVLQSNLNGLLKESTANTFEQYSQINKYGIEVVSTDTMAPELPVGVKPDYDFNTDVSFDDFEYEKGEISDGVLELNAGSLLKFKHRIPSLYFGGIFLSVTIRGKCRIDLLNQNFEIETERWNESEYQLLFNNEIPDFSLKAIEKCKLKEISLKIIKY